MGAPVNPSVWQPFKKKAKYNEYRCRSCICKIITVQKCFGHTPMLLPHSDAYPEDGCKGIMVSAMEKIQQKPPPIPTHTWYKLPQKQHKGHPFKKYLAEGGLLIRKFNPVTDNDPDPENDPILGIHRGLDKMLPPKQPAIQPGVSNEGTSGLPEQVPGVGGSSDNKPEEHNDQGTVGKVE